LYNLSGISREKIIVFILKYNIVHFLYHYRIFFDIYAIYYHLKGSKLVQTYYESSIKNFQYENIVFLPFKIKKNGNDQRQNGHFKKGFSF